MIEGPTSDSERRAWVRLARTPSVGPVTFFQLIDRFKSASAVLDALPELARKAGRRQPLHPPTLAAIDIEWDKTTAFGGALVLATDAHFPPLLKRLAPPPPVLTLCGDSGLAARPVVGIVGARNASAAGRKIARDMARTLSDNGYVIVSGLARGIDGEAHAAALDGGTIAVLGGGIDHIYPPQHDGLYHAIKGQGLLMSESPFGHRATAKDFPRRNRLITGCCQGLIVVEATEQSGSLISARMAGEQGRDVMAVPGSPLDPRAAGTNRLLRDGATLVRNAFDAMEVLRRIDPRAVDAPPPPRYDFDPQATETELPREQVMAVRNALTPYPLPIDTLADAARISPTRCAAILVELELAGEAITLPGALAASNVL